MFTLLGIILFFLILLIVQLLFIYLLPILLSSKVLKLGLTKKQIFKFSLLNLFFPLSIFFLGKPYKILKEKGKIKDNGKIKGELIFFTAVLFIVLISFGFKHVYKLVVYKNIFSIYQLNDEEGSMLPKYYDKEFVIINRISNKYERGNTVIFNYEKDWDVIKNILAVEGDTIKSVKGNLYLKKKGEDKFIKINLSEEYKPYSYKKIERIIGKNKVFLLSSNTIVGNISYGDIDINDCLIKFDVNNEICSYNYINKDKISGKIFFDFGYYNRKEWNFKHPSIIEKGEFLNTYPKFFDIR